VRIGGRSEYKEKEKGWKEGDSVRSARGCKARVAGRVPNGRGLGRGRKLV